MGCCRPFVVSLESRGRRWDWFPPAPHLGASGRHFHSSEEQNRNRMSILRCLSVNPGGRLRCCRNGLSSTVRPEGDPGMSLMPLVQGYHQLQVRNIRTLQILAQWKWICASACLASHICSLKVYFPSFHSLRKFATVLLVVFLVFFYFFFPFIFLL